MKVLALLLLALIAFGQLWAAYESHVANEGVQAMAHALSHDTPDYRLPDKGFDHGDSGSPRSY